MNIYYSRLLRQFARDFGISYTQPYKDVPKKVRDILMYGTEAKGDNGTGTFFEGVIPNLQRRFDNTESDWVQHKLHQYMSEQPCEMCCGTRLKKEALAVRLHTLDSHSSVLGCAPSSADSQPVPGGDASSEAAPQRNGKKNSSALGTQHSGLLSLPGCSFHDVATLTVSAAQTLFSTLTLS